MACHMRLVPHPGTPVHTFSQGPRFFIRGRQFMYGGIFAQLHCRHMLQSSVPKDIKIRPGKIEVSSMIKITERSNEN